MNNLSEFMKGWLQSEEAAMDIIAVKRKYIDICDGNLYDGLMLSQIMFWHGKNKETGKPRLQIFRDGHYWLAKSYEDWWEECRVNERTARRSVERLEDLGVVETRLWKFAGAPTKHIRIVWEKLEELLRIPTEPKDGKKTDSASEVNSPLRSDGNVLKGQMEMSFKDSFNGPERTDPIHRLSTDTTSETTSEIIIVFDEKPESEQEQVELPQDKKRKDMASHRESQKAQYEKEFEELVWPVTYNKKAKAKAMSSYCTVRKEVMKTDDQRDDLLEAWRYVNEVVYPAKHKQDGTKQFIPMPTTWFNQHRWNDEDIQEGIHNRFITGDSTTPPIDLNSLSKEQKADYERKSNLMAFYAKQQQKNGGTAA